MTAGAGPGLADGVHSHFGDPTVRAHALIVGYRRQMIMSCDVAQSAAEVIADLTDGGEAWTELAMASADAPRSELLPILDRAAAEIEYARTDEESELDLLEAAAYRAVAVSSASEESARLDRVEFDYQHADELESLRLVRYFAGEDYDEQVAAVCGGLVDYLNRRYER